MLRSGLLSVRADLVLPVEACGAWRDVEERLRPYVSRRVPPAEVDDVIQDILMRLYRGMSQLREGGSFGAWAYSIAERVIADAHRKRGSREIPVDSQDEPTVALGVDDPQRPEDEVDLRFGMDACVAVFVARLRSPYREAITLTELQGLTQKEAAELMGVSLSGMKSRVQRGREAIRNMFERCCEISLDRRGRVMSCEPRTSTTVAEDCGLPRG